jgi:hypothetical protein
MLFNGKANPSAKIYPKSQNHKGIIIFIQCPIIFSQVKKRIILLISVECGLKTSNSSFLKRSFYSYKCKLGGEFGAELLSFASWLISKNGSSKGEG